MPFVQFSVSCANFCYFLAHLMISTFFCKIIFGTWHFVCQFCLFCNPIIISTFLCKNNFGTCLSVCQFCLSPTRLTSKLGWAAKAAQLQHLKKYFETHLKKLCSLKVKNVFIGWMNGCSNMIFSHSYFCLWNWYSQSYYAFDISYNQKRLVDTKMCLKNVCLLAK